MASFTACFSFTKTYACEDPGPPPAVKAAFSRYAMGGTVMSPEQLCRFLVEFQGETGASVGEAEALIDRIRARCGSGSKTGVNEGIVIEEFYQMLFSVEINPPIIGQVHHDMTAPISQYYIYTGHNSYLTGNQLNSNSSDVPIIEALQRGVRVIELDLWPNSAENDISVLHGRTLTSPVDLITCLQSIKKYAFEASPYPVVVTLEDHLTPELQAKAAQMITDTFGDSLYYPESENVAEFPSPESLKYRILISTKPPNEFLDSKKDGDPKIVADLPKGKHEEVEDSKTDFEVDKNNGDQREQNLEDEDDGDDDPKLSKNTAPEYRRLITIAAGKPKGRLTEALKVELNTVRRLSLSELQLKKAAVSNRSDVRRFTERNLLRIYPKGTRLTSSNYNPFNGWMVGAQMVAFNMQGYGKYLWMMQGFFKANGGCGFVRKPECLRDTDKIDIDRETDLPVKTNLKVTIYMSDGWRTDFKPTHFDSFSPPDFYTRVGIAGVPADRIMKQTKIIEDNWIPVWNEEFTFPLTVPEIAVLRIEVLEDDMAKDDFGGQYCLPVTELRTGIRAVPLCGRKGEQFKSVKLLMRFEFSS